MINKIITGSILGALAIVLPGFSQNTDVFSPQEISQGWQLLFDGKTTEGWTTVKGDQVPSGWQAKDGILTAVKGGKGGDIISTGQYSDFELIVDFNISAAGNSGVKYFFSHYEQGGNLGFEYQILDDDRAEDNKKANHLTGSLYDVLPPNESLKKANAPGQWNTMRVVAKGKKVQHWLNGVKILEFVREADQFTDAVASSKFNKAVPAFGTPDKGHILLQEHGAEVSFKNIKIREL